MSHILHHIWLNGDDMRTMPEHVVPWVRSWRDAAVEAGWEWRMWYRRSLFELTTQAERERCAAIWKPKQANRGIDGQLIGVSDPIHVMALKALSDLMRYRLLCSLGGLYVDLDIELVCPTLLDEIGEAGRNLIVHPATPDTNCNCLLYCPGGAHRGMFAKIEECAIDELAGLDRWAKPTTVTGPRMISRRVLHGPGMDFEYGKVAHPTIAYAQWPAARPVIPGKTRAIIHNRWRSKGFAAGAPGDRYDPSATERNVPRALR